MISQAHITAWRETAPWSDDAQVEQDLVPSRAVVEVFAEPRFADALALRGGTALNKLFMALETEAQPNGPPHNVMHLNP